jgi:hypothetical protein
MRTLLLALAAGASFAAGAAPLTLEQAMADPDWIGPPVENPAWSLDGKSATYQLKRTGSTLRDTWSVDVATGTAAKVEDARLAEVDAAAPVYDKDRRRALFVRNGDVFLRDLSSNALRQLSRSDAVDSQPRFTSDGRAVIFLANADWMRYDLASGLLSNAAILKAEKDPAAKPAPDSLRDTQLRHFHT